MCVPNRVKLNTCLSEITRKYPLRCGESLESIWFRTSDIRANAAVTNSGFERTVVEA